MEKKKVKPIKHFNRYLLMSFLSLLIIVLVLVMFIPDNSLKSLVPEPYDDLYIDTYSDEERSVELAEELKAEEVLVVTYGINSLKNSNVRLELFRYSDELFPSFLENHLAGETILIGGTEVVIPCETINIDGTNIKSCKYSSEDFAVVKQTFPVGQNTIARILCTESSIVNGEMHCREIATGVIKNGK